MLCIEMLFCPQCLTNCSNTLPLRVLVTFLVCVTVDYQVRRQAVQLMKQFLGCFLIAISSIVCFRRPAFCQQEVLSIDSGLDLRQAGVPFDWTHRHVVFSSTSTSGATSRELRREPRYQLEQLRRLGSQHVPSVGALYGFGFESAQSAQRDSQDIRQGEEDRSDLGARHEKVLRRERKLLKRDWAQTFQLGGTAYSFTSPTYPAKFSVSVANPTPNCNTDYVVFTLPTGGGVPGNFNIIAYNNLYVTAAGGSAFCAGTAPTAMFEYNASSAGGTLNGSPVLSLDGTLIAFVENAMPANGGAVLHILKWHSGDIQTLDLLFPAPFNLSALPNCATNGAVAPCQYSLQYTPSASRNSATLSSPFVDYLTDTAYVSDDGGNVYAIAPVFTATPTNPPAVLSGWPVNVGAALVLTPPVYDATSKNIFVASTAGTEFFVQTPSSTMGSCLSGTPPCVGSNIFAFTGGGSIAEAPVVDSTTGRVFVSGTQAGGASASYVVQADTQLSAGSIRVGRIGDGTVNAIHPGTPDNNYFTSVATGKLYVCGQTSSGAGQLFAYGFDALGVMNTTPVTSFPLLLGNNSLANAPCTGALTENFNQSVNKDFIFVGVKSCAGATSGCVVSLDVTSAFPTAVRSQLSVVGGTTGIIVDNVTDASATKITTDIYFILLGSQNCLDYNGTSHAGTCAVSATQSGLQ
jgi:hypothetical protein